MTITEVRGAFDRAKVQTAKRIPTDEFRRLMSRDTGEFDAVGVKIGKGKLTTGDPLGDFIAIKHGVDKYDEYYEFYSSLKKELSARTGDLIAVVEYEENNQPTAFDSDTNLKKFNGWVDLGVITKDSMGVLLQGDMGTKDGEIVAYYPALEVSVGSRFSYYLPRGRRSFEPTFHGEGVINFDIVSSIQTASWKKENPDPFSKREGQQILIGYSEVSKLILNNKMQDTLKMRAEMVRADVKPH